MGYTHLMAGKHPDVYTFYHGSVTGRDNVIMRSFIHNGFVSRFTQSAWDQEAGLYVAAGKPQAAIGFARSRAEDDFSDPDDNKFGRGMLVELKAPLDGKNWRIDHEMSTAQSMQVIEQMKDYLPHLPREQSFTVQTDFDEYTYLIKDVAFSDKGLAIDFSINGREPERVVIGMDRDATRVETCLLDKIHFMLHKYGSEQKYEEVNFSVLKSMADQHTGSMKYVGTSPLTVSRILLRPENGGISSFYEEAPLSTWEVAHAQDFDTGDLVPQKPPVIKGPNL